MCALRTKLLGHFIYMNTLPTWRARDMHILISLKNPFLIILSRWKCITRCRWMKLQITTGCKGIGRIPSMCFYAVRSLWVNVSSLIVFLIFMNLYLFTNPHQIQDQGCPVFYTPLATFFVFSWTDRYFIYFSVTKEGKIQTTKGWPV